jgi:hypothetical protein
VGNENRYIVFGVYQWMADDDLEQTFNLNKPAHHLCMQASYN